jgi:putative ABC transport system substrate-binding protein
MTLIGESAGCCYGAQRMTVRDELFCQNHTALQVICMGCIASMARVPAIYPEREYADDGGLIAYGPNVPAHFRLAAGYVDRILRGANPGDLPINATSQFDFVINLRAARALGLALPPDFVSAANEVIE